MFAGLSRTGTPPPPPRSDDRPWDDDSEQPVRGLAPILLPGDAGREWPLIGQAALWNDLTDEA